jgi:hypothetical protein
MSSGRKTRKSDSDIEQELVPTVHKRHSYAPTESYASDDVEPELVPLTPLDPAVLNHPAIKKIKTYVTPGSRVKRWLRSTRKVVRERQCPHTGECLVLGKRFTDIYRYFNKFVDFSMTVGDLHKIAEGRTGHVAEVHYKRGDYSAYAVLKSMGNMRGDGDNLAYEYIVGVHFINHIFKFFPCFIYTYGLFKYNTPTDHESVLQGSVASADLSRMLTRLPYSITPSLIRRACGNKAELCLLVQHLHKVQTLKHYLDAANEGDTRFLNDLPKILFILYHALDALKSVFTHYDFHYKNVLIYELPRVTEFRYEYPDGVVTFKMKYLPKIVDYGRCYFNYAQNKSVKQLSSEDVRAKICSTEMCMPCTKQYGLRFLTTDTFGDGHTQVRKKNISHDLRLLYMIDKEYRLIFDDTAIQQELRALVARVKYDYKYSTSEQLESVGDKIYNVSDAHIALKRLVEAYPDDSRASDILVVTGTTPVVQI